MSRALCIASIWTLCSQAFEQICLLPAVHHASFVGLVQMIHRLREPLKKIPSARRDIRWNVDVGRLNPVPNLLHCKVTCPLAVAFSQEPLELIYPTLPSPGLTAQPRENLVRKVSARPKILCPRQQNRPRKSLLAGTCTRPLCIDNRTDGALY